METQPGRTATGLFMPGYRHGLGGRPAGSRNKAVIEAEKYLLGYIAEIYDVVLNQALDGNLKAVQIILDRIHPPLVRGQPELDINSFVVPEITVNIVDGMNDGKVPYRTPIDATADTPAAGQATANPAPPATAASDVDAGPKRQP